MRSARSISGSRRAGRFATSVAPLRPLLLPALLRLGLRLGLLRRAAYPCLFRLARGLKKRPDLDAQRRGERDGIGPQGLPEPQLPVRDPALTQPCLLRQLLLREPGFLPEFTQPSPERLRAHEGLPPLDS